MNNIRYFFIIALAATMSIGMSGCKGNTVSKRGEKDEKVDTEVVKLREKAAEMLSIAKKRHLSENVCLMADYSIPSGTPRVFLWDFRGDSVIYAAHTMHGNGRGSTPEKAVFSSEVGSECTTLGLFEVTKTEGATQHPSFRMRGLDKDNKTAWERTLMIHGSVMAEQWIKSRPKYLPIYRQSCQGCITLTTTEIRHLAPFLKREKKNILLLSFI